MKLIPRIRERRMEKHMTQTDLSKLTGISKSRISLIENNKVKPNTEILWKIAIAIGCKVDDLYEISSN